MTAISHRGAINSTAEVPAPFRLFQNISRIAPVLDARIATAGMAIDHKFRATCGRPLAQTGEGFADIVLISLSRLDAPEARSPVHEG